MTTPEFRSGFACFVGRPNVGKSTLMNALVGTKVAITSNRPQTTRRAIRGIVHRPSAQLVIVDTPGLHRPRTLLGERLDSLVRGTLTEVDVIGFCVPADEKVGDGDRYIARELAQVKGTPVVAIVTKADKVGPQQLAEQLMAVDALGDWADIVPVSAVGGLGAQTGQGRGGQAGGPRRGQAEQGRGSGRTPERPDRPAGAGRGPAEPAPGAAGTGSYQLDVVADLLVGHLPEGPPLYPEGDLTDEPEQILVAEFVREAALEGVEQEVPHSIAVVVDEMGLRPGREDLTDIYAHVFVERPSQKAILIGRKGARLREVGTRARRQIEAMLGTRVYLNLQVSVAKDWQRNPKQLRRLGFYD
ncbi:GTPase Era [Actinocorallia populi]|uniref:GTPase Era n=1 Tax=Actinocorallia populi TaxID=2079200 RepID=UPI001E3071AE|nr:GTPase Era [Actinocorallia populi]